MTRAAFLAGVLWVAILLFPRTGTATQCLVDQFRPEHDAVTVENALAQVFRSEVLDTGSLTNDDYKGTAFVVDSGNRLLLTAAHVAQDAVRGDAPATGRTVALRFPRINEGNDLLPAKVLAMFKGPLGGAVGGTPNEGHHVRDVALLQIESLPDGFDIQHLRLHLSQWSESATPPSVTVQSFYNASSAPIPAPGVMTRVSDPTDLYRNLACLASVTITTDGGDSGAPVLSSDGFVLGMVLQDFPKGGVKQGQAMPAYCITDHLSETLKSVIGARGDHLANEIYSGPSDEVARMLRPSRDSSKELSNPAVHFALTELGRKVAEAATIPEGFIDKLQCPVYRAVIDRRIDYPKSLNFAVIAKLAVLRADLKSPADQLLKRAFALRDEGRFADAAAVANTSRLYYAADAVRILRMKTGVELTVEAADPIESILGVRVSAPAVNLSTELRVVQSFKGYTDGSQLYRDALARIGVQSETPSVLSSEDAALLAVAMADGKSSELTAQSWAALGKEAFDRKDFPAAYSAYGSALSNGASQPWVTDSYSYSWSRISEEERRDQSLAFIKPGELSSKECKLCELKIDHWAAAASASVKRFKEQLNTLAPNP